MFSLSLHRRHFDVLKMKSSPITHSTSFSFLFLFLFFMFTQIVLAVFVAASLFSLNYLSSSMNERKSFIVPIDGLPSLWYINSCDLIHTLTHRTISFSPSFRSTPPFQLTQAKSRQMRNWKKKKYTFKVFDKKMNTKPYAKNDQIAQQQQKQKNQRKSNALSYRHKSRI